MAAEGEFAFVIAVFAAETGLIDKDLYASVVLAVLLSTIFPPFLLRFTITHYNKLGEKAVEDAMKEEESSRNSERINANLLEGIKNCTAIFLCIQTQSQSKWGLLGSLMRCMASVCATSRRLPVGFAVARHTRYRTSPLHLRLAFGFCVV